MMVDPAALREALAGLAEKWDEYGGPFPDEAVIVDAARELLRRIETAETVWWCEVHLLSGVVPLFEGDRHCPMAWRGSADPCRMVEAVLTRRDT